MSKYILLLFLILIGCSKSYIDSTDDDVTTSYPMQVVSTYSSVDYTEMSFYYSDPALVHQIEIRRDTIEVPLTEYDGESVFFDDSYERIFYDYNELFDQETLSQSTTYYYSIFYRGDDNSIPPIRITDVLLNTLTYKEGMLQLVDELTDFSLNLNENISFLLSSELAAVLFDEVAEVSTVLDLSILGKFDGLIVQSLQYSPNNIVQDSTQLSNNLSFMSYLNSSKAILAVDYCTVSDTACIKTSRQTYTDKDIIGLIRPESFDNIVDDLPSIINETSNTSITDITDTDLKNFIFLDSPFDGMISQLTTSNYDLVVMTPFSETQSWDTLFTAADITSLKVKENGTSTRLVYAYIDITRIFQTNGFYWETDWNDIDTRPNWVVANISDNSADYYIKYWRSDWKTILKSILPSIINAGYDGIVFGGADKYSVFPLQLD